MRIPKYSELIDNDTIAFFPFNGNLTDMCGNYSFSGTNQYTQVTEKGKTFYVLSGNSDIKSNNSLGLITDSYGAVTIDFCFKFLSKGSGGYPTAFQFESANNRVMIGMGSGYFSAVQNTYYFDSRNYAFRYTDNYIIDNKYHHMLITESGYSTWYFYLDGKYIGQFYHSPYSTRKYWKFQMDLNNRLLIFNYRFRKGTKYTKDFICEYNELYAYKAILDSEENLYGVVKE